VGVGASLTWDAVEVKVVVAVGVAVRISGTGVMVLVTGTAAWSVAVGGEGGSEKQADRGKARIARSGINFI